MKPDAAALLARAREAAGRAHAPYSGFRVGAAVLAGGEVFTGCNVENASYGLAICAERVALFAAVAAGHSRIEAVALACVDASTNAGRGTMMPCGACRQVMAEFAGPELPVHVDRVGTTTLGTLLPDAFRLDEMHRHASAGINDHVGSQRPVATTSPHRAGPRPRSSSRAGSGG